VAGSSHRLGSVTVAVNWRTVMRGLSIIHFSRGMPTRMFTPMTVHPPNYRWIWVTKHPDFSQVRFSTLKLIRFEFRVVASQRWVNFPQASLLLNPEVRPLSSASLFVRIGYHLSPAS
jgi:hypothetical protein